MISPHHVYWCPNQTAPYFPPLEVLLSAKEDLVAVGGSLLKPAVLEAYRKGLFPWYHRQPILWYSPWVRFVLEVCHFKVPKSLQKFMRRTSFTVTYNKHFDQVITTCASIPRKHQSAHHAWLHKDMIALYQSLHRDGHAVSVEVWQDDNLVGGLYGLLMGGFFFGESMFHRLSHASKVAFVHLVWQCQKRHVRFIDCQTTDAEHLRAFGAKECNRATFYERLVETKVALRKDTIPIYLNEDG